MEQANKSLNKKNNKDKRKNKTTDFTKKNLLFPKTNEELVKGKE